MTIASNENMYSVAKKFGKSFGAYQDVEKALFEFQQQKERYFLGFSVEDVAKAFTKGVERGEEVEKRKKGTSDKLEDWVNRIQRAQERAQQRAKDIDSVKSIAESIGRNFQRTREDPSSFAARIKSAPSRDYSSTELASLGIGIEPIKGATYMAEGGLVTQPTKAIIGEAGPEIVLPLSNVDDAIKLVYKQGASVMLGSTAGFLENMHPSQSSSRLKSKMQSIKNTLGIQQIKKTPGTSFGLPNPIEWWNRGRNERVKDENKASWGELWADDNAQKGMSDEAFERGEKAPLLGRPDQAFNPFRKKEKGGPGSGPTPMVRQVFERPARAIGGVAKGVGKNLRSFIQPAVFGAAVAAPKSARQGMPGAPQKTNIAASKETRIALPSGNGHDNFGRPIILNPSASSAWRKAMRAAAADGVDLRASVNSSYRSMMEQAQLVAAGNAGNPNVISPAAPGMSPHGQGWALDIDQNSEANEWMRNNGNKFGWRWQGDEDPVHFDYANNEANQKWLKPKNNSWLPEAGKPGQGGEQGPQKKSLAQRAGDIVNAGVTLARKAKMAMKFAKIGSMFGPWGTVIGGVLGAVVGDPPGITKRRPKSSAMEPPVVSSMKESVNSTPVQQEKKSGVEIVPLPLPQPPVIISQPGPSTAEQEKKIEHFVVIDTFGRGVRKEVISV